MVYDFGCTGLDGIHFLNPRHLILRLELFSHASLFDELTGEQIKHLLRVADADFDMETAIRENKIFLSTFCNAPECLIMIKKDYNAETEFRI